MADTRKKDVLHSEKIADERDKRHDVHSRVYELPYTNKAGKSGTFKLFSVFSVYTYERDGKQKFGQSCEWSMNKLKDVVELLFTIDKKFNQGKAFESLVTSRHESTGGGEQVSFADDDIPF